MPLVSRDALTARGDPFGSVGSRSRFGEGDPFIGGLIAKFAKPLLKKAGGLVGRAILHRGGAPMSANLMTRSPVFGGSALPIEENVSYMRRAMARKGLPAGSRMQVFRAGVGATYRRHHRMRVTNVRALRRAMRRVQGFAKLAHQTISFTHRVRMRHHRRKR